MPLTYNRPRPQPLQAIQSLRDLQLAQDQTALDDAGLISRADNVIDDAGMRDSQSGPFTPTPTPPSPSPTSSDPGSMSSRPVGATQAPDPSQSIKALQGLSNANGRSDSPSIDLLSLQDERKSEFEDRAISSARAGDPNESAAMRALAGQYQQDIAENPLTKQKAETDSWQQAQDQARLMGFGGMTPAGEAGQFGRMLETRKVEAPIDVARMQGETARDVAGTERAGGFERMLAQTGSQEKIATERNQSLEQRMQDMYLANISGTGGMQPRSFNPSTGAMSFGPDSKVEPGAYKALQDSQAKLTAGQPGAFASAFGRGTDPALVAAHQQAQATVLYQMKLPDRITKGIALVLNDPVASQLPVDQLIKTDPQGFGAWSPQEQESLRNALGVLRGRVF